MSNERQARERITVIIPTFNEVENLPACLASVSWADEILVVDSFSTDDTPEIARRYNARILQHEYKSHAAQRNWAIPQANHPWILLLDADERVTPELREELLRILADGPENDAYRIRRRNYFLGREIKHSGWGKDWIGRFFHRDRCHVQEWGYHGDLVSPTKPARLTGTLIHYTYPTFDDYFRKFQLYTTGGAEFLYQRGKRAGYLTILSHSLWAFLHTYILRRGFLDGVPGLIVCAYTAFSVFTKYAKMWHLQQQERLSPPAGQP